MRFVLENVVIANWFEVKSDRLTFKDGVKPVEGLTLTITCTIDESAEHICLSPVLHAGEMGGNPYEERLMDATPLIERVLIPGSVFIRQSEGGADDPSVTEIICANVVRETGHFTISQTETGARIACIVFLLDVGADAIWDITKKQAEGLLIFPEK